MVEGESSRAEEFDDRVIVGHAALRAEPVAEPLPGRASGAAAVRAARTAARRLVDELLREAGDDDRDLAEPRLDQEVLGHRGRLARLQARADRRVVALGAAGAVARRVLDPRAADEDAADREPRRPHLA